jgi:hypothetical protein
VPYAMLRQLSVLIVIEVKYIAAKHALKQQELNLAEKQKRAINLPPGVNTNMQLVKSVIDYVKKKK